MLCWYVGGKISETVENVGKEEVGEDSGVHSKTTQEGDY
jgi:hypothetical protein